MTKEGLAAKLNGRQYREEITNELEAEAKASGLLVIFGASDDLVEFRGGFCDEVGAYRGNYCIRVDKKGIVPNSHIAADEWSNDGEEDDDDDITFSKIKEYVKRREYSSVIIKAVWDSEGYSWVIKTDVPHATFDIMGGNKKFCRGIVLDLNGVV